MRLGAVREDEQAAVEGRVFILARRPWRTVLAIGIHRFDPVYHWDGILFPYNNSPIVVSASTKAKLVKEMRRQIKGWRKK